jgi:hypothetical protein
VRPCIDDTTYGYRAIDTADQRREPDSLLNWTERRIRMRRECPERSWGEYSVVRTEAPPYGHRCTGGRDRQRAEPDVPLSAARALVFRVADRRPGAVSSGGTPRMTVTGATLEAPL